MTIFVVAVGLWALVEAGHAAGRASAGVSQTRDTRGFVGAAILWLVLAGGALGALLV